MLKKALFICLTFTLINLVISSCKKQVECGDNCGFDPVTYYYSFDEFYARLSSDAIECELRGEESDEEIVFNFSIINQLMACSPPEPTYIYQDTLQELKVYLKSNDDLIEISEDITIESYVGGNSLYTIQEYLEVPTVDTYDEQIFTIISETENLIRSDSSYMITAKFSNNDEVFSIEL